MPQWFEMPDYLWKLILTFDCRKQVKCAYFLSVYFLFKATKAKKAYEGQQRPSKSKTPNLLVIATFQCKSSINVNMILKKCVYKKSEILIFIT